MMGNDLPVAQSITISDLGSGTYRIDAVPDIDMRGKGRRPIQWSIATAGWSFDASQGIVFATHADEIDARPGRLGNGQQWQVTDRNTRRVDVKYTIHVVGPKGERIGLDPIIKNGDA